MPNSRSRSLLKLTVSVPPRALQGAEDGFDAVLSDVASDASVSGAKVAAEIAQASKVKPNDEP